MEGPSLQLIKSLLLARLLIGTVKGEEKSNVQIFLVVKPFVQMKPPGGPMCKGGDRGFFSLTGNPHVIIWKCFLKTPC